MQIFIKTLIVTLILCIGYYVWMFLGKESYKPDLSISENAKTVVTQQGEKEDENKETPDNKKDSKFVTIYMLSNEDSLKSVKRQSEYETLYSAVKALLNGPTKAEIAGGIFTEIPSGTKLISVKDEGDKIIINLTKEFGEGGGTQSIQARVEQIAKTAKLYCESKPVYLYLEGSKAQYIGGEGIYIEQPLK